MKGRSPSEGLEHEPVGVLLEYKRTASAVRVTRLGAGVFLLGFALGLVLTLQVPAEELNVAAQATPGAIAPASTDLEQAKLAEETEMLRLQNERLRQEAERPQLLNLLWNNLTAVAAFAVGLFGVVRWGADQRVDREKRGEERYLHVVEGLGSDNEGTRVGAAVTMRTFLQPGYERFYPQIFNLAVGHLRLRPAPPVTSLSDPLGSVESPSPSPFDQALVTVFQEAYPRARDYLGLLGHQPPMPTWRRLLWKLLGQTRPPSPLTGSNLWQRAYPTNVLAAEGVWLSRAHLDGADLRGIWSPYAHLGEAGLTWANLSKAKLTSANLSGAHLVGAKLTAASLDYANLSGADLTDADLTDADLTNAKLEHARSLKGTRMYLVKGLTQAQLDRCAEKGARMIVHESPF